MISSSLSSSLSSSFRPFRLLRLRRLTPTPTLTLRSLLLLLLLVLSSFQQQSLLFTAPFAFNSNSNSINNNGAVIRKRSTSAIIVGGGATTATRLSAVSTTSLSSSSTSKSSSSSFSSFSSSSSSSSFSSSLSLSSSLNEDEKDDEHQQKLQQQQREEEKEDTNVLLEEKGTNNNQFYSLRKVLGIDDDDNGNDIIDNNDSSSSSSSNGFKFTNKFPYVVGHRGCLYEELENTREGFLKCNEMGCDSIELDVFKIYTNSNNNNSNSSDNNNNNNNNNDGEIIVFHGGGTDESNPGDLLDYCGVEGSILDYNSIQDIQRLKFNSHHQEFQCPINKIEKGRIPTLRQVLLDTKEYNTEHRNRTGGRGDNNNPDDMKIIIELKGPDISIVEDVLKLVEELNVTTICSYSSFDLQKLKLLRKLKPNKQQYRTCALYNNITPTGIIVDDYEYKNQNILNCSLDCGVTDIHLKYDTCYKNLITKIHQQGFHTMGWMRGPIGMKHDILNKYNDYNNTGSSSISQCEDDVGEENTKLYGNLIQTGVQSLCINKPNLLIDMRNKIN